jgi:hypothetical protein
MICGDMGRIGHQTPVLHHLSKPHAKDDMIELVRSGQSHDVRARKWTLK